MSPSRVLIVDDNEDMLVLIPAFLATAEGDIEVVGVARDAQAAFDMYLAHEPDLLLVDLMLPGDDGLAIAEQVLEHAPDVPILLFSEFLDDAVRTRAEQVGVRACVPKDRFAELPGLVRRYAARS